MTNTIIYLKDCPNTGFLVQETIEEIIDLVNNARSIHTDGPYLIKLTLGDIDTYGQDGDVIESEFKLPEMQTDMWINTKYIISLIKGVKIDKLEGSTEETI